MRVFVTGATGFVGSAVVKELLRAGHQVVGLARSDAGAETVEAAGAQVLRGDLADIQSLRSGAGNADGVIHTGFSHDWAKFAESCEMDRIAIETLGAVLKGSNRPLLISSGVALLAPGRLSTEDDTTPPELAAKFPRKSEEAAFKLAADGVNAGVVRLPPSTHGEGDHGFVPILIDIARQKGSVAYVGEGQNHWPATHRVDAAAVYRLALEHCTPGARFHAIAEEGVPFKQIAEAIGKGLNLPVVSKTPEEAQEHFGWFGTFVGIDASSSSAKTRNLLGWEPTQPGLLADMAAHYFKA